MLFGDTNSNTKCEKIKELLSDLLKSTEAMWGTSAGADQTSQSQSGLSWWAGTEQKSRCPAVGLNQFLNFCVWHLGVWESESPSVWVSVCLLSAVWQYSQEGESEFTQFWRRAVSGEMSGLSPLSSHSQLFFCIPKEFRLQFLTL